MTWLAKLHPRAPKGSSIGGEFIGGSDWASRLSESIAYGSGRPDLSRRDSGMDWSGMLARLHARNGDNPRVKPPVVDNAGEPALSEIYHRVGYHAKPEVVSHEELQQRIRQGAQELWRGVEGNDRYSAAEMVQQYKTGDLHYAGHGFHGNGTYSTPDRAAARQYGAGEGLMQFALKPDARVTTREAMIAKYRELSAFQGSTPADEAYVEIINDPGRLAALLGYDALIVPSYQGGPSAPPEMVVVLNRNATIVADTPEARR